MERRVWIQYNGAINRKGGHTMSILEVKNVKKTYSTRFGGVQVHALTDVSFSVEARRIRRHHGRIAAAARRRCSTSWPRSTARPAARCCLNGQPALLKHRRARRWPPSGAKIWASYSRTSTCWTPSRSRTTSCCRWCSSHKQYPEMNRRLTPIAKRLGISDIAVQIPLRGLRRAEAARRRRPRADHRASADPGRRADRRARFPRHRRSCCASSATSTLPARRS